jgi:superoxide dismutase, Fe-Mn family
MQVELPLITLPELTYGYNSLEPVLIGEILQVHHQKHHQAYVTGYNAAVGELITKAHNHDAEGVQVLCGKVAFTAGGHNAHKWYWENLAPSDNGGGILPDDKSPLTAAITKSYGSYENFIAAFNAKTAAIQGSGWGWLAINPTTKNLSIEQTFNQVRLSSFIKFVKKFKKFSRLFF